MTELRWQDGYGGRYLGLGGGGRIWSMEKVGLLRLTMSTDLMKFMNADISHLVGLLSRHMSLTLSSLRKDLNPSVSHHGLSRSVSFRHSHSGVVALGW